MISGSSRAVVSGYVNVSQLISAKLKFRVFLIRKAAFVKISDCMKGRVITVRDDATIGEAAVLLRQFRIGTLPVVDKEGRLVGLVQLRTLLELVMPDFVKLVANFDFVHDFGALENRQPESDKLDQKVTGIIDEPVSVHAEDGLIRAASLLEEYRIRDLPVVDQDNKVVGIASHVDIGVALMSNWQLPEPPLLELT